jgi:C4-dicarboxylate-specific signal transduction histidine kinase
VLIVEDDDAGRHLLRLVLTEAGYAVDEATDGHAALAAADARPDLVLLDRGLPGLDGDAVCRALKGRSPTTPVIMLTAASSSQERLAGFAVGADDYVAKPYDLDELLARVAVFDRLRRAEATTQQRAAELATLLSLMNLLVAETDPPRVLRRTAEAARELAPSAGASIALVEPDGWRLIATLNGRTWSAADATGSLAEGVHGWVARHRRPYRLTTTDDPVALRALAATYGIANGLLVPLLGRDGSALAVLGLYDRLRQPGFSDADERVLVGLAAQAALALENARLVEGERRRAEELAALNARLRESQAQLVQAGRLAAVGTLAAGVAHELNGPLMVIRGQAQRLLTEPALTAAQRRGLERIERQTERMETIIEHLRGFARPIAEGEASAALNEVVHNALLLCREQFQAAGIDLRLTLAEPSPRARAHPGALEQALLHLLTNTLDALAGRGGRVWIATGHAAGMAWLAVRDDGPGMSAEVMERIFEPFFTTKEVGQGAGLGLTIALKAVERCGGTIGVESAPGQGAAFTLTLPAAGAPA